MEDAANVSIAFEEYGPLRGFYYALSRDVRRTRTELRIVVFRHGDGGEFERGALAYRHALGIVDRPRQVLSLRETRT